MKTVERPGTAPVPAAPLYQQWREGGGHPIIMVVSFFLLSFHRFGVSMCGGESLVGASPWISPASTPDIDIHDRGF